MKESRRDFVEKSVFGVGGLALGFHNFKSSGNGSILGVNTKSYLEKLDIDLLKDESAWSTFSPRKEITPSFSKKFKEGDNGHLVLAINGNNNPDSVGCWLRKLPLLIKDRCYHIESSFRIDQVEDKNKSIRAVISRNQNEYAELYILEKRNGQYFISGEFTPDQNEGDLEIRLYLIGSEKGTVQWNYIKLKDETSTYNSRLINVAAVSGKPSNVKSSSDAIEYYCGRIDKINSKNLDLICLGEFINIDNVPGEPEALAEAVPGPSTVRLGEKAKELNTYIVASILERDGSLIYNTAILIGRDGQIVGTYHKVHVTIGEQLIGGVKPGNDYPVFQTDFGKVGLMVCYDNHFPEVARILAVKGAELIAYPNFGDGREWPNGVPGGVWEPYMRTRAIDNHVAIVSAVNSGRSCIVNGGGEILNINKYSVTEPGAIVRAIVDLNTSVINYSGRMIQKRYLISRHPETYGSLIKHIWDFE